MKSFLPSFLLEYRPQLVSRLAPGWALYSPVASAIKWRAVVWGCVLSAGLVGGCAGPASDHLTGPSYRLIEAKQQDLLYTAVLEIQTRCHDLGNALMDMYLGNQLSWGSEEEWGEASIGYNGWIQMNYDAYNSSSYADPLEMLIADLYHEAAHALNNEVDGSSANNDPWNRPGLNSTSFDGFYLAGTCPTVSPPV